MRACFGAIGLAALVLVATVKAHAEEPNPGSAEVRELAEQRLTDQALLEQSNARMRELRARRQAQMAQDSMHPSTREAWNRWNADSYDSSEAGEFLRRRDFMRLQRDWEQVQSEAHKGNISPDDNSRFLREHAKDMKRRMVEAGAKHDLTVSLQDPSGPQKTFSDVDAHGRPVWRSQDKTAGQAGEMTVEQFIGAREDFNARFNRDLEAHGLGGVDNPAAQMRSDLMPITDDPELFRAVEARINPDGGVMYQDPQAVRQEVLNRQQNPDGSWKGDSTDAKVKAAYLQEQIRQQRAHAIEAEHMLEEGNRLLSDPASTPDDLERGRRLIERSQGEGSSLIGKYEERANRVINQQAGQAGTDGIEISPARQAAIDAVGGARDAGVTQQSAEIIATTENAIKNQQVEGVRTLMSDGEIEAAAEVARNADANTRGRLVDEARAAAFERHRSTLEEAGLISDPDEITRIANAAADDDAARLVSEMRRNSAMDVYDPQNNRWILNSRMNEPTLRQRLGQAAEVGGQVMQAADILNAGADVVDYSQGRIAGSELAERLGSRIPLVGDAYGAGRLVGERVRDRIQAQSTVNEANAAIQASWAQDAGRQARLQGATTEEAIALREALATGDDEAATALVEAMNQRGIDYSIPPRPGTYWTEPDEGYSIDQGLITGIPRRTVETVQGMGQALWRAGRFVVDTAGNIVAVVGEGGQIVGAESQVAEVERERIAQAAALRRDLEERGVDPDRALGIAQAFARGDVGPLIELRTQLQRAAEEALADAGLLDAIDGRLDSRTGAGDGGEDVAGQMTLSDSPGSSVDVSNQQRTNEEFVVPPAAPPVTVVDIDRVLQGGRQRVRAAEDPCKGPRLALADVGSIMDASELGAAETALAAIDAGDCPDVAEGIQNRRVEIASRLDGAESQARSAARFCDLAKMDEAVAELARINHPRLQTTRASMSRTISSIRASDSSFKQAREAFESGHLGAALSSIESATSHLRNVGSQADCSAREQRVAAARSKVDRIADASQKIDAAITACDLQLMDAYHQQLAKLDPARMHASLRSQMSRLVSTAESCKANDPALRQAAAEADCLGKFGAGYGPGTIGEDGKYFCRPDRATANTWCNDNNTGNHWVAGRIGADGSFDCNLTEAGRNAACASQNGAGWLAGKARADGSYNCYMGETARHAQCQRQYGPGYYSGNLNADGGYTCYPPRQAPVARQPVQPRQPAYDPAAAAAAAAIAGSIINGINRLQRSDDARRVPTQRVTPLGGGNSAPIAHRPPPPANCVNNGFINMTDPRCQAYW